MNPELNPSLRQYQKRNFQLQRLLVVHNIQYLQKYLNQRYRLWKISNWLRFHYNTVVFVSKLTTSVLKEFFQSVEFLSKINCRVSTAKSKRYSQWWTRKFILWSFAYASDEQFSSTRFNLEEQFFLINFHETAYLYGEEGDGMKRHLFFTR